MARDGEFKQRQHFCHHRDTICHPKSGYIKPNCTKRLHVAATIIRSFQTELFSSLLPVSYADYVNLIGRGGGASEDVENRVAKAWSKWRELSGVMCDKKITTKLKLLIYQTVIRPTLLYGCDLRNMANVG